MTTFGTVAFDLGYITSSQLARALEIQRGGEDGRSAGPRLGEILVSLGYLTEQQAHVVEEHRQSLAWPGD